MKNCLGIEIGHYRVKIAYMEHGELQTYVSERLETENQTDMKVYAELIKDVLKENNIRCKNAVFVLRQDDTYVKRCSVPLMTVDQLKLNLPFEFHDYIGDELEQYQFDYGVIGLERILEHMNEGEEKKDFAVLDLGTKALRMHFFRKGIYDTTRTMEPGCEEIEQIRRGDKEQLVQLNVDDDDTFWGEKGEKTLDEALSNRYQTIAVQAMRVLNFYSFNNSDNTIDSLYYCGGGARYKGLIDTLSDTVGIPVKSIGEILPELDAKKMPEWIDSPQTVGVLLV